MMNMKSRNYLVVAAATFLVSSLACAQAAPAILACTIESVDANQNGSNQIALGGRAGLNNGRYQFMRAGSVLEMEMKNLTDAGDKYVYEWKLPDWGVTARIAISRVNGSFYYDTPGMPGSASGTCKPGKSTMLF